MTTLRLSWLACGLALIVLLHGAVESLARASGKKVEAELRQEEIAAISRAGYDAALKKLRLDPYWAGQMPSLTNGTMECRMRVANYTTSPRPGFDGQSWVPAHAILLDGLVMLDQRGADSRPFQSLAEYRRPRFGEATSQSDPGIFTSPLPPSSSDLVLQGRQALVAGSYGQVTVKAGANVTLIPNREQSIWRIQTLTVEPKASLDVEGEEPAIFYIGKSLAMRQAQANAGRPAALLQIYLLEQAAMRVRACPNLSLVAAGPTIEVEACQIHGALQATHLDLKSSQVDYEERLRGVSLDGLGPLELRDHLSR